MEGPGVRGRQRAGDVAGAVLQLQRQQVLQAQRRHQRQRVPRHRLAGRAPRREPLAHCHAAESAPPHTNSISPRRRDTYGQRCYSKDVMRQVTCRRAQVARGTRGAAGRGRRAARASPAARAAARARAARAAAAAARSAPPRARSAVPPSARPRTPAPRAPPRPPRAPRPPRSPRPTCLRHAALLTFALLQVLIVIIHRIQTVRGYKDLRINLGTSPLKQCYRIFKLLKCKM